MTKRFKMGGMHDSLWQCPICHKITDDYPALSRKDNKTNICNDCGQTEALEDYFGSR